MLLIDTIINCKNHYFNRQLGDNRDGLIEELSRAQKFVLERDFSLAADLVPDEEISRTIQYAKPPFDTVWFETAAIYRERFVTAEIDAGTMRPQRVGVLVHADPENFDRYMVHLFWRFTKHDFAVCPVAMIACLNRDLSMRVSYMDKKGTPIPTGHFMTRFVPTRSMFSAVTLEVGDNVFQQQFNNWGGEVEFWSAVLVLLSCRNAASIESVKRAKTTRHASGKILSDYNLCTIRLPKGQHASSDPKRRQSLARAHFVRGHFKIRKTGMFFWHPYRRGNPERGFVNKDYRVMS